MQLYLENELHHVFFLKSRYFTEQVWETISRIGGVCYEIILKTYGQFG